SSILSPGAGAGPGYSLHGTRVVAVAHHGRARLAVYADADGSVYDTGLVEEVTAELGELGIGTQIVRLRQTETPAQAQALLATADITAVQRNASQTGDSVEYLRSLPYLPRDARTALDRIDRGAYRRRDAAAAAVASMLEKSGVYI